MQNFIDNSYLDWTRSSKPMVRARGIASIIAPQFKAQVSGSSKDKARCVWPSGFENMNSRYLSRRVYSR